MTLDSDFHFLGDCIARPRGFRRWWTDRLCRLTGHLLWRSGSVYQPENRSLQVRTAHCRRCFVYGYVEGDYAVLPLVTDAANISGV